MNYFKRENVHVFHGQTNVFPVKTLCLASLFCLLTIGMVRAASLTIDSLSGPVTQNEINSFITYMQSQTPPPTPWGPLNGTGHNDWADGYGGRDLEAMGEMFEVSSNLTILNLMISWADDCTSQRNDLMSAADGGQRVMWTGLIDKVWCPNWPTDTTHNQYLYCGCETEDVIGHLALCAKLILQTPAIWNLTVPDGDPYGYGTTYFQRATNYLAKCDEANSEYFLKWFIQPDTGLIVAPTNSAWTSLDENVNAINREMMFTSGFQRLAEAHELLGDNPALVAQLDAIVRTNVAECLNGMIHFPGNPRTANGQTVYNWGYYPTSTSGSEATEIHAEYDMIGLWRAFNRPSYGFTRAPLVPFANTMINVIYLGSNTFATDVDGGGGDQSPIYSGWILPADWNPEVYTVVAGSAYTNGWYKNSADIDAGILLMKNRRYEEFSVTLTTASATLSPGAGTNLTVAVAPLGGFTNMVSLTLAGLPPGATGGFSSPAINLATLNYAATNVTLSIATSISTPIGSYPLSIIGTSGSVSHTNTVNLVVGSVNLVWTGGSLNSGDWSDAANWGGTTLAPGDGLSFAGTTRLFNVNDTAADTGYSNLTFNPGAGAFLLTGNPITLSGASIENDSINPQTIYLGLNFDSAQTLDGADGPLIIAGGLTNIVSGPAVTTLTLAGGGQLSDAWNNTSNPGGTNEIVLNDASSDWTVVPGAVSTGTPVPWVLEVNQGTLNFGTASSAPVVTLTTPDNSPADNQVGNLSGATGAFNLVNGTLTTASRFNTGTAANATGIVNQAGGTFNIGVQFQGANAVHVNTGVSIVNLSGGVMNINPSGGTNGTFYVASRGMGTLNVSGRAVLNCGTLDVSRGVSSEPSRGIVNLNGGTIGAAGVTDSSTTAVSTATLNFNGGTLQARSSSTAFFTQSATISLTANVQSGGAVFDTAGFDDTVQVPLLHDGGLGTVADGGLTKLGVGTLTLTTANTYTGNTIVENGTLALSGNASLANSPDIIVAGGSTFDVSGLNSSFTLGSNQTLSNSASRAGLSGNVATASGTVSLTYTAGTPSLTITNGTLTLSSGTTFKVNNTGAALAAGGYNIISAGTDGSGTVAGALPPVTVSGNGLAAGTVASLQINGGGLDLEVSPVPRPHFTRVTLNGTTLTIRATNGVADGQYELLETTNLALPLAQWTVMATNAFDANGNFYFTNTANLASPQTFYLLKLP
jgi:autotransporter-associated beta strand protein